MGEYEENREFEAEVRRVAEAIWGLSPGECQPQHYAVSGPLTELDGLVRLRDMTHVIMATVSRKLEKTKEDVRKLGLAATAEAKRGVPVAKWFVTRHQLEAQHVQHAREHSVTALTLDAFRNRFFNGHDYIAKRRFAPFGSARHLGDGSATFPEDEYVPLPMSVTSSASAGNTERELTLDELVDLLRQGRIVVMVGPFGAGKSLTTREVFLELSRLHDQGVDGSVPVAVNLREHWGQQFADEILDRHARGIGFVRREDLVIAWRAGIARLLIDGFDEAASQVVAGAEKVSFMRQARFDALAGVRDLILGVTTGAGALLCGRDHYFDDHREMIRALGLTGRPFALVRLAEFTEEQAATFLARHGATAALPDWLPRKPLILGYLAHRALLFEILAIDSTRGFGYAWDQFLRLICEREAAHGRSVMDPETLRRVLERLACNVRATSSGTGPITGRELAEAYQAETAQNPGEGVLMQLQRLPGLTQREQDPGARSFIDEDLLAALQGSAVARMALESGSNLGGRLWLSGLSTKGVAMAAHLVREAGGDASTVVGAARRGRTSDGQSAYSAQMVADLIAVALTMAKESGSLDCHGVLLEEVSLEVMDFEETVVENLAISGAVIDEVIVGSAGLKDSLKFRDCMIRKLGGIASSDGLPPEQFQRCTIEEYDDMATNAAVVHSTLPPGLKALLTVLRKLYLQPGGGRKIGGLKRGLPSGPVLDAVDGVVSVLESEGLVAVSGEVVQPVRRWTGRIRQIIAAPSLSSDRVVERVRDL
jgi:hypothetical protein